MDSEHQQDAPVAHQIDFQQLSLHVHLTKKDETIATLEKQVQRSNDRLCETYFYAILVVTILVDMVALQNASIALVVLVGILEAIGLIAAARRFQVEGVEELVGPLLAMAANKWLGKKDADS